MLVTPTDPVPLSKKPKKKKVKQTNALDSQGTDAAPSSSTVNRSWGYEPPPGFVVYENDVEDGDFDYDQIKNNDDLELWIIRMPDGMKAKHLEGLELPLAMESPSSHAGTVLRKHASYDVWHLKDGADNRVGEETLRLSCLLPRKKKAGKLYTAPKPISNHYVIAAQPSAPMHDTSARSSSQVVSEDPARYRHPQHLLKHRFLPYGSSGPVRSDDVPMNVDGTKNSTDAQLLSTQPETQVSSTPVKERSKSKKRKADVTAGSSAKGKKVHSEA